jgi:hypothetical protein
MESPGMTENALPPSAEVYNAIKSNNTELLESLLTNQSLDLAAPLDNNTNVRLALTGINRTVEGACGCLNY